jgi:hypothetical protein
VPDSTLISIAAAVATRTNVELYDLVKREFSRSDAKAEALRAAEGAGDHSLEVSRLAAVLEATEQDNPDFGKALRGKWRR